MKQFATIIAAFVASAAMARRGGGEESDGLPQLSISYANADDYVLGLSVDALEATTLKLPKSRAPRDENGDRVECSGWQLASDPAGFTDFTVDTIIGDRGCTSWAFEGLSNEGEGEYVMFENDCRQDEEGNN